MRSNNNRTLIKGERKGYDIAKFIDKIELEVAIQFAVLVCLATTAVV
ncbi:hypothetical protein ALO43_200408 [Pseudomonas tremae]|uniref:GGDEF domain-containing protein n=1 Tax=Pseudomonas tremae TaxID=200454 RepID=A0AA40P509_9PSED|nr:hypothetical protein ALO43_200408 [Pseudomonas tremae]